ncbi:MAG TPA: hypothetical protein VF988_04675 [Verrucomicrobiae bacterium]
MNAHPRTNEAATTKPAGHATRCDKAVTEPGAGAQPEIARKPVVKDSYIPATIDFASGVQHWGLND